MTNDTGKTKDMTSLWLDWQRDFWENWMAAMTKGMQSMTSLGTGYAPLDMFSQWHQNWLKSVMEPFLSKEARDGLGATVFNRVLNATNVYYDLMGLWGKSMMLLAQVSPGGTLSTDKVKEIYDQWIKDYQTLMGSLWSASPSSEVGETAKAYQSATGVSADYAWRFMEPVMKELERLPEILTKIAKGEAGATVELAGLLRKNYDLTWGRLLRAPALGYYRGFTEHLSKTIDAYVRFNATLAEYYVPFYHTGLRAAEKVFQRLMEFQGKEMTPETLHEFYRIWWTINEDVYHELFQSEAFTKLLGEALRQGLLYKKQFDDLTDEVIGFTNLPTKREMDEVYRSIYELRKEVRWQRRAIKELEAHLGIQATGPSPTEKAVQ